MTYLEAKARRHCIELDGVRVMCGGVPYLEVGQPPGMQVITQAVTLVGPDGLDAAHERLIEEEKRNGVVYE